MTRDQYIHEYARSHQNRVNQHIHLVCVPVIFIASVALAWQVPLFAGTNLAMLAAVPILAFYASLGLRSFATGALWMGASLLICGLAQAASLPTLWLAAGAWILAWAAQFYGHYLEGEKPSFSDDLVFLLIGPLFVQEKLRRLALVQGLAKD